MEKRIMLLGNPFSAVAETILSTVLDKLPIGSTERFKAETELKLAMSAHAGEIAAAEASIASSRKDEWLADMNSKYWLANNWRPMTAMISLGILVWEGVLINIANTALFYGTLSMPLPHTPVGVVDASMWIILALVGARSAEKITGKSH
jgi:hypothetical protein